MDGWVVIGTQLDTKQLEADLKNAKKELSQFQKEEEKLLREKGKVELSLSAYDEEKAKIKANTDELLKKAETESQVTNLLNMENIELEKLTQKYSKQFSSLDGINDKLKNNAVQQGVVNNKIEEANKKLSQAKGYKNVEQQIGKISDKTSNVVKQVGRWALAIFSVRSAYSFLSRASSTLAQYNKEYGANLEYIRYVLAQALAPVLQFLVNLAYKLLTYINYIAQAWFGVNLFSNASVKNFQKMAGSAASIKKSLQTTPFDEMNVLSDTSSSGGAGGGIPSFDLAKPEDVPIPSWLQWIIDNKDIVLATLAGIATALLSIHFGLGLIKGLGIGLIITGAILLIQDLMDYFILLDGSLENSGTDFEDFGKIVTDIGLIIIGLGMTILGLPGIVAGVLLFISGLVLQNWETIKGYLTAALDWIDEKLVWLEENFGHVGKVISGIFREVIGFVVNLFKGLFTSAKQIFDGILLLFKGDFKNGFISIGRGIFNLLITIINGFINGINAMIAPVRALIVGLGQVLGQSFTMENIRIPNIPMLKVGGIVNMPGKGVPVGRARAGEAGAEGVLPLTDSQAMETLGEAIGRYITINANIVNNMNGRVISRQLQQIKGNQDFAYNK
jgi:hypothetical protein